MGGGCGGGGPRVSVCPRVGLGWAFSRRAALTSKQDTSGRQVVKNGLRKTVLGELRPFGTNSMMFACFLAPQPRALAFCDQLQLVGLFVWAVARASLVQGARQSALAWHPRAGAVPICSACQFALRVCLSQGRASLLSFGTFAQGAVLTFFDCLPCARSRASPLPRAGSARPSPRNDRPACQFAKPASPSNAGGAVVQPPAAGGIPSLCSGSATASSRSDQPAYQLAEPGSQSHAGTAVVPHPPPRVPAAPRRLLAATNPPTSSQSRRRS